MTQQEDHVKSPYLRKEYGGNIYTLLPMKPIKALSFFATFTKCFGQILANPDLPEVVTIINDILSGKTTDELDVLMKALPVMGKSVGGIDNEVMIDLALTAIFAGELNANDGEKDYRLDSEGKFNAYFNKHPSDMLPIAVWAVWENVKHFLSGKDGASFQDLFRQVGALRSQKAGSKTK